jgi:hypothetical protein
MPNAKRQLLPYLLDWPRAIFFTLRFREPRGNARFFGGFSSLRFLRAARLAFLRSSLLNFAVLAMSAGMSPFPVQRGDSRPRLSGRASLALSFS